MISPISSPDSVSLPDLVAQAAAVHLSALLPLSGLSIATEKTNADYQRPILVIGCDLAGQRIHDARVFTLTLRFSLETTDKTTDDQLLKWDGAIWADLTDTRNLPALLNASQPGILVHAALSPTSSPTNFSGKQRDISYQTELIAQKVPT